MPKSDFPNLNSFEQSPKFLHFQWYRPMEAIANSIFIRNGVNAHDKLVHSIWK